jgi:hypothetical protein
MKSNTNKEQKLVRYIESKAKRSLGRVGASHFIIDENLEIIEE